MHLQGLKICFQASLPASNQPVCAYARNKVRSKACIVRRLICRGTRLILEFTIQKCIGLAPGILLHSCLGIWCITKDAEAHARKTVNVLELDSFMANKLIVLMVWIIEGGSFLDFRGFFDLLLSPGQPFPLAALCNCGIVISRADCLVLRLVILFQTVLSDSISLQVAKARVQ